MRILACILVLLSVVVYSIDTYYDKSPTIRLKTSALNYEAKDLIVELTVSGNSLTSGKEFSVVKTSEGLEFNVFGR